MSEIFPRSRTYDQILNRYGYLAANPKASQKANLKLTNAKD
ncbi:hypothetical protein [Campylobacter sp.]